MPLKEIAIPDGAARSRGADLRLLILGCLLFVSGSALFYMLPPYLALIGGRFSLDASQVGTLAAVESLGIGITSLLGPLWISRLDHRLCAVVGILACVIGNSLTALGGSYHIVLLSRLVLGLFGEGVLLTLGFAVLGLVSDLDRAFAIALTAAVAFGAAIIAAAAELERIFPAFGPLAPLVGIAAAALPFLGWFSFVRGAKHDVPAALERRAVNWPGILALIAQLVWFAAPGAFWTFAEQVVTDKGIASNSAELALSIGEFASLIGSVFAAWLGFRWGRLLPIVVAGVGMAATAVLYEFCTTPFELALVLSAFYIFWNYGVVYQMSFVSSIDKTGQLAVMMPAVQVFGLSLGPLCAGRGMAVMGDSAVTIATIGFAAVGIALYFVSFRNVKNGVADPPFVKTIP